MIKNLIPLSLKKNIKYFYSTLLSILNGNYFKFSASTQSLNNYYVVKEIMQVLKNTSSSLQKKHNLQIAIACINNVIIKPNQIFSFWHLVKNPTTKNGYKKSRAISGNNVTEEVGGGLCQLSGLIYYLSLHTNVKILERHNHSIDIYTEEERFTPLGSDATVVYGYKDLQFKNNLPFAIAFLFAIIDDELVGKILSQQPIEPNTISFNYLEKENSIEVNTIVTKDNIFIYSQKNSYKKIS